MPKLGIFLFKRHGSCCGFQPLQSSQMIFSQVKTAGNESDLQKYAFNSASAASGIPFVPLDRAECALRLYAAVHPQQGSVNTVQILQNFFMDLRQFRIQSNGPIPGPFAAFLSVWAAGTIFTPVNLFCPTVFVALDRSCFPEQKPFFIRTAHICSACCFMVILAIALSRKRFRSDNSSFGRLIQSCMEA